MKPRIRLAENLTFRDKSHKILATIFLVSSLLEVKENHNLGNRISVTDFFAESNFDCISEFQGGMSIYEYQFIKLLSNASFIASLCKFYVTSQHAKKEINFPPSLVWSSIRIFGLGWGKVVAIFLILLDVALHEMERALKSYIIFYMVPTRLSVYVFHGARLVSNEKFIWVEF